MKRIGHRNSNNFSVYPMYLLIKGTTGINLYLLFSVSVNPLTRVKSGEIRYKFIITLWKNKIINIISSRVKKHLLTAAAIVGFQLYVLTSQNRTIRILLKLKNFKQ